MRTKLLLLVFTILAVSSSLAQSPLDHVWRTINKSKNKPSIVPLTDDKISAGLKEALKVSTEKAVASTGRPDGFLKNEAIKILLPDKLRTAIGAMRLLGMGQQLDELEIGMNRAAEQATPLAEQIFVDALYKMTIDDARRILTGSDTAATEYFRRNTSGELTAAFKPVVHRSMQGIGVIKQYNEVMQNPAAAQLVRVEGLDIDNYVLGKTLDGLFYMLGQEEKEIRKNPAARTTALLREVFGNNL
jgi:hypothetical protein